jgi:hypothetical protein
MSRRSRQRFAQKRDIGRSTSTIISLVSILVERKNSDIFAHIIVVLVKGRSLAEKGVLEGDTVLFRGVMEEEEVIEVSDSDEDEGEEEEVIQLSDPPAQQ